jgi:hypothetical protein
MIKYSPFIFFFIIVQFFHLNLNLNYKKNLQKKKKARHGMCIWMFSITLSHFKIITWLFCVWYAKHYYPQNFKVQRKKLKFNVNVIKTKVGRFWSVIGQVLRSLDQRFQVLSNSPLELNQTTIIFSNLMVF